MLVDRIIELSEDGDRIVLKNLILIFFSRAFSDNPVMPGVLQLEAMAQVAGVLLNSRSGNKDELLILCQLEMLNLEKWLSQEIN